MRCGVTFMMIGLASLLAPIWEQEALADTARGGCFRTAPSVVGCQWQRIEVREEMPADRPASRESVPPPPGMRWDVYPVLVQHPEMLMCLSSETRLVSSSAPASTWAANPGPRGFLMMCPGQEGESQDLARATQIAHQGWAEAVLPAPDPHIAPGRAITGLGAYLETRGQLSFTFERPTELGQLVIEAMSTYHVDWGDGTTSGPHRHEGEPWPDGRIMHVYRDVGA